MFALDRTTFKKKEILVKNIRKNLIALNCHWHWTIQRSKVKIYLKYSSWIYAKEKKLSLVWPIWLRKKTIIDNCCSKHAHDEKCLYKRYVMPLIKSKMKTVNWKKKKKFEYIIAKYLLLFSLSWKILHRNKWQQVKIHILLQKRQDKNWVIADDEYFTPVY